jgi:hypothetical protein
MRVSTTIFWIEVFFMLAIAANPYGKRRHSVFRAYLLSVVEVAR